MRVTEPRHYATDALLRDGGSIHIRAIRPDDKQRLLALFERLSNRSVYFRFFQTKQRLTDEELRYFTELDFSRDVALVATLQAGHEEHIIGVGRYFRLAQDGQPTTHAEVAFTVADAHQGRGVGTLLLEHLAAIARRQGIDTFEAYVLGENNRMLEVFEASGFTVQRALDTGVFHVSFPTADTPQVRAASTERERAAAAQSIAAFLNPRAVAVVGVSRRGDGVGAALLANLQRAGFPGRLYPIHPHATAINGLPAFPRVSAVGAPVDLALIAVPASAVEDVVADCATAGVHGVVVLSSGFAEASAAGREAEQRLRDPGTCLRHAPGRPELYGDPQYGSGDCAQCDVYHPCPATGGQHWHAVAEWCAWTRHAGLCPDPPRGPLDVRLHREPGGCVQ